MKKNLLLKRLFSVLFLLFISTISWAYDFQVDGIYYDKNSDGTSVTVTYTRYRSYSGDVVIPSSVSYEETEYSVTSIGSSAFEDCSGLTSINIPEGVTSIGSSAFEDCSGLTSINIPEGVTSIGSRAFNGCSGLTSITIPNSVTYIGDRAFEGCTSLPMIDNIRYADTYLVGAVDKTQSTYNIKANTRFIGDNAFYGCSGLTSVTIPNSVTSIGERAFSGCSGLTSITIPNSVTSIGWSAFSNCFGLTSVTIPNSVTSIGASAFWGCSGLTSVTIGNSVTSISDYAFYNCSGLTSITIPNSVTYIGDRAFEGCTSLPMIDNIRYADTYLVGAVDKTQSTYNIKANTRFIGGSAFYGCTGLTSITIPNSVTSIGEGAFRGCSGLTLVTIPNSVTSISNYAFYGCSGLITINIPEGVTSIGNYAFYNCSGLTTINIPEGVTSIGDSTFSKCNFRTIVSKPIQPKGFPDTFSQPVYNHTMLYVPQNSYWDYVFNSEWYRFLHIKEFAVDEVEARQAYMLADTDGTNFTVYNAASDKLVTKEYMHQVDETSLGSNWVAEPCGAGMALLNLGAEKYAQISSDGKISLSDTPQELDIEFSDGVATANGRQMMLVLNDNDDITDVVTLRYTPTASEDSFDPNAPIYDLMGRRLQQKPAKGYYIQNGKKYLAQ